MKKLGILALLLISSVSFGATTAKTSKTNSTSFDVRVPIKNWIKKFNDGFRVGIAQGSLETNVRARQTGGFDSSANEGARTKFQIHAGYEKIRTKTFGYSVFGAYQDQGINENVYDADLRNMRIMGNATYGLTNQAYTYGGLNYGKFYGSEEIESNIDAGIGFQAGIGLKLHKKANLEVEYLSLINEGRIQKTNYDLTGKGILIKLNTPFSFNI